MVKDLLQSVVEVQENEVNSDITADFKFGLTAVIGSLQKRLHMWNAQSVLED